MTSRLRIIASSCLDPNGEVVEVSAVEMHRADPKLKRTALLGIGAAVLLGGAGLWMLEIWLDQAKTVLHAFDVIIMGYVGLGVMVSGGSLALAWSFWQEASMVRREGRYPPQNMRTLHDVAIVHGDLAVQAARRLGVAALGLLIGALLLIGWVWSTVHDIAS